MHAVKYIIILLNVGFHCDAMEADIVCYHINVIDVAYAIIEERMCCDCAFRSRRIEQRGNIIAFIFNYYV